MNKVLPLIVFIFTTFFYANAQEPVPGMKWQATLGGSSDELVGSPNKISLIDRDGGYLIGGITASNNGDISGLHYSGTGFLMWDIWVAKLDSQRNISWSACLGGTKEEGFGSLELAHDSGYIVAGYTFSTDGDVTQMHGDGDAWIVRLGSKGNIVWQKSFGGSEYDVAEHITKSGDGYIFIGSTRSNDGDVSGSHGNNTYDIWVVKLDKNGNILWQKCLGGSSWDVATAIKETADGGFIVTGLTMSKDGDVQGLHDPNPIYAQNPDIWVVKLDNNGAIQWQKCLGGLQEEQGGDIELTATGGYMVAGYTKSLDGDVTGHHGSDTTSDAWVVNLSSTGNIIWQKCFGGTDDDEFSDIQMLPDHSFVAVGATESPDGDVSHVNGLRDCWLVKFNNAGDLIWEKTFGNTGYENGAALSLTTTGNIVVTGSVFYDDSHMSDLWLFEAGAINTITGYVFYDANSDGIQNNNESYFDQVTIRSTKNGQSSAAIPYKGNYELGVDTGSYATVATPYNNYYTIVPALKTSVFSNYFNTDTVNFAVQPQPGIHDLTISMISPSRARPGFDVQYQLIYKNVGTAVGSGSIKLVKDSRISFTSALPAQTTISNDTLTWNFSNLDPNTEASITVGFQVGTTPSVNQGDTLRSIAWIEQIDADVTPVDDTVTLKQIVTGSYDPNDKTEANAGIITPEQVNNGQYLNYLIRFQNTGTDTAFNVTVRDTLESRLDWNSLQMITASHSNQLSIEDGNKLTWLFNNIKLPDSNVNEAASHGYIAYRIKPLPTVAVGDTIKNTAGIYFDYNLPVATNTSNTIVFMVMAPLPVTLLSFNAAAAGTLVNVTWKTSLEQNASHFEVQRSANGVDFTTIGIVQAGNTSYLFQDKQPLKGYNYYRLKSVDKDDSYKHSSIVLVNVKDEVDVISSLYPNPGNGNVILKLQGSVQGNVLVQVLDQQGRVITAKQLGVQNTAEFKAPLDLGKLSKGNYLLKIVVGDKIYMHKLLIQ